MMQRWIFIATLLAGSAQAQCVMCYRNASAQSAARARALNRGIAVLAVPPLVILGGFLWLAWRRR